MSRFRRRLMGLAALGQPKADDFVRVEYIESTGTQWIDTGYKINNVDSFEIIIVTNGIQKYMGSNGNLQVDLSVSKDLGKRTIKVTHSANNGPNTYVNGSLVKSQNYHTYNGYIIALFAMGISSSAVGYYSSAAVYSAQLIINNTLVRDYIPVLNKATNEYGMYDLVEQKFYTSPNGAKFVGGREIIYDAEIEYLESTGTQWIDTLYVPKGYNNTIETKITHLGYSTTTSWLPWFSTYVNEETNTYRIISNKNLNSEVIVYNGNKAANGGLVINVTVGTDYDFKIYPSYFLVNGTRYDFTTSRGKENTNALHLFGNKGTKIRMWGFKLTKGSTVVLDMIPVRVGNVGYMYDKVSNKLFGNVGSGSFILGQDTVVYDKI